MISAVLPIRITDNSFWSSSTGAKSIKNFLDIVRIIEDIDEYIVLTPDISIRQLVREYDFTSAHIDNTQFPDRPYTLAECLRFAKKGYINGQENNDRLIMLDHRNFFLQTEQIENAISIHNQNPGCCLFSLSFLEDYPCQYKTFFSFLGCEFLRIDNQNFKKAPFVHELREYCCQEANCELKDGSRINFYVSLHTGFCSIAFRNNDHIERKLVAHIIPFDINGPLYDHANVVEILPWEHKIRFDLEIENISSILFLFTYSSQTGEFDTVEIFAPSKAPWQWSGQADIIIDSKTDEPMFGRQQFSPAFAFDSSICLLNRESLIERAPLNFLPVQMKKSCLVTDWVDYYRATATQIIENNSTS